MHISECVCMCDGVCELLQKEQKGSGGAVNNSF